MAVSSLQLMKGFSEILLGSRTPEVKIFPGDESSLHALGREGRSLGEIPVVSNEWRGLEMASGFSQPFHLGGAVLLHGDTSTWFHL